GLQFNTIAPLHGPILKGDLAPYWLLYDKWSRYEPETQGVLIAYASIYGGTAHAARTLATMLKNRFDGEVVLLDLSRHDVSYAVAEAFRLSHIVLASVTYDGDLFPPMHNFIHHLQRKNLRDRTIGIIENGSWAPAAARIMTAALATTKNMTILSPTVTLHSRLHQADMPTLETLAANILDTLSSPKQ
ncbi:MAG: FprA family A-type flavoprotein, partial [Muribaculaceae bacterium]|nr:FprA family A-type flavoprotein [Muribaculaceae bacterium]